MEKKDIRKMVARYRGMLSEEVWRKDSLRICEKILALPEFEKASAVYVYMDCKGEVSTKPLIEEALRCGKRVAAPRVCGEDMTFYWIRSYADVAPGYYGIPEPVTQEEADAEEALLIVPGVGFDSARNRCGYGKGFYDRYLAAHPYHTTVAVAFAFQMVDEVPVRGEDIRPQYLITPDRIFADPDLLPQTVL